jgi:hypothetical protein
MAHHRNTSTAASAEPCSPEEASIIARFNRRAKRATERALDTAKYGSFGVL